MPDDSSEFATDNTDFTSKMNRKSIVVGRGRQLNSLINTYAGQIVYCTETENGFTLDNYYKRNSANTSWSTGIPAPTATESVEESNTLTGTFTSNVSSSGQRWYSFITMPTTYKFYVVTKIEWKNGSGALTTIICGIDTVDAIPPSNNTSILLGNTGQISQVGGSTVQSTTLLSCDPIRGGTKLGLWLTTNVGTNMSDGVDGPGRRKVMAYSNNPPLSDSTAWDATSPSSTIYLKIYYRGYILV